VGAASFFETPRYARLLSMRPGEIAHWREAERSRIQHEAGRDRALREQEQNDGPRRLMDDPLEQAAEFPYSVARAGDSPAVAAARGAR